VAVAFAARLRTSVAGRARGLYDLIGLEDNEVLWCLHRRDRGASGLVLMPRPPPAAEPGELELLAPGDFI